MQAYLGVTFDDVQVLSDALDVVREHRVHLLTCLAVAQNTVDAVALAFREVSYFISHGTAHTPAGQGSSLGRFGDHGELDEALIR